ncbi:nucleotidyltransferase family protein [Sphingorhabdus sp.]|uniref:nucleotidyltransferase domain-containing protein n=1 Tax=Sphingorhabdus sp. TaxID=1902408 RepID=UPI00391950EA
MRLDAVVLADALREPATTLQLDAEGWIALITIARSEQLLGTLARRLAGLDVPAAVQVILDEARTNAEYHRRSALWEADCARRALKNIVGKVVLMKGTAYVAAGLKAGEGRHIGDLDIMVAHDKLAPTEAALLAAGWEWVKPDPYDDAYYRNHMHELPPMIHKERDRMVDVHHTILPLTARPRPDAQGLLNDSVMLNNGLYVFSPADMVIHSAAHLFADGELDGGLRNLWDVHCLLSEFADESFWQELRSRAEHHELWSAVHRAARLAHRLYGTEIPKAWLAARWRDILSISRMTARDDWGRGTRKVLRFIFYVRGHWLRMPRALLVRHLWVKWRRV